MRHHQTLRLLIKRLRNARAEQRTVVFFSVSSVTDIQFVKGLFERLRAMPDVDVILFTGKKHLSIDNIQRRLPTIPVYPYGLMPWVRGELLITTSTWLGWCRPRKTRVAHVLHSLASIHIYPEGTFDDFDVIFAKGPHHEREFNQYYSVRRGAPIPIYPVGCERVDRLYARRMARNNKTIQHVTYAPTFGEGLSLQRHGEAIVTELMALGIAVTLRPHIISFQESACVIDRIVKRFGQNPKFKLDEPTNVSDLSPESDLVVTDWSGAAFEFALAYDRPVLFLEGPRKNYNTRWQRYFSDEGIQVVYRERLGGVIQSPAELPEAIRRIENQYKEYMEQISSTVPELLFHRGQSVERAVASTLDLIKGAKTTSAPSYRTHTQTVP